MASCNITKKFIAELIGTFFLVFFGTGSAVVTLLIDDGVNHGAAGIGLLGGLGDWLAIGLAFGLTVMACIYLFGKISGAHLNPAVTIGLLVSKNISLIDSVYYIVAQVIGAVLGSLLLFVCLGAPAVTIGGLGATAPGLSVGYIPAMIAECIGTFFLMLVVFAISFFGAFDIKLPDSWANKMDENAEKTSGLLSIFFMAFTLTLVSFSCTGPIIGTLLVEAAGKSLLAPAMGMLGFAIALALPFSLFAMFPSVLKKLPKSGGWMNTFKVTLAFLELALALKFLSVADLAYGWHILDREVFVSLWIVIFSLLGCYLLGLISFPHDDDDHRKTSVPRLFLAIISLAFAMYSAASLSFWAGTFIFTVTSVVKAMLPLYTALSCTVTSLPSARWILPLFSSTACWHASRSPSCAARSNSSVALI